MENQATTEGSTPETQTTTEESPPIGISPIAELKPETTVNVLAACIIDPWGAGKNLWKTRLADASGEINISIRHSEFNFKSNDIVRADLVRVHEFNMRRPHPKNDKGGVWLVVRPDSNIVVNPDADEEVTKLREWHQNQVSEKIAQRAKEGFTPIADLVGKETVHVLAVCTRDPWQVGKVMWKTLLRDQSGQVVAMKRNTEYNFKLNDVIAAYSMRVSDFKGDPELEVRHFSDIVVNPDSAEASKLKEWYQKQVSQVDDQTITKIADLKKNTTATVLAVCTSDPMERPTFGSKRRVWQATLRDASGYMNAMKDDASFTFGLNDVIEARRVFVREFILGVEMVIDGNTVITVNPETEEAAKLKEWYQSQGIRDCVKLTEETDMKLVEAAQNQLRSNFQIKCNVCDVWCSGSTAYKNHVTGRPHYNAVMAKSGVFDAGDGKNGTATDGGPPAKKHKRTDDPNEMRCDICDVPVSGQPSYDAHMKGAKHLKKVQEEELTSLLPTLPHIEKMTGMPPGREYKCIVCNAFLSCNKVVILNHLKGARHAKAVTKHAQDGTLPPQKDAKAKELVECKICNVFVNSQSALEIHRNAPKHRAKEAMAGQKAANDGPQEAEIKQEAAGDASQEAETGQKAADGVSQDVEMAQE